MLKYFILGMLGILFASQPVLAQTSMTPLIGPDANVTTVSGTFTAAGQTVEIPLNGSASGLWTITTSNFVGTVVSEGCIDTACAIPGGRILFKSGVGSIATNTLTFTGTAFSREYRVVGGGNRIRLRVSAYSSGTMSIVGYAQSSPSILFVNGPVHTSEEESIRASRAYTASTGVVAVSAGNYLNAVLCNPTTSGVNMFITQKRYNTNIAGNSTPLEYQSFLNPTTVPTTAGTINNRWISSSNTSAATFKYQMTTTNLSGGTQGAGGILPTGGIPDEINVWSVLTPGSCTGISIGGGGGGLTAAARASIAFVWYEETIG